jgi:hypothetical protein
LTRFLSSPAGRAAAVALGIALCAPSLTTGLVADDWFHRLQLTHRPLAGMSTRPLDLFTFADGNPVHTRRMMDSGLLPWWTDPEVHLSFWRPVTALTHALDYVLWPDSPIAMHAQSLVWFGLALAAVAAVYASFLPPAAAGLALLLYAIDDAHGPAVGWLANRNAMVSVALALPALALHHRWRQERWRAGAVLAMISFAIGLLAGESAVAVLAYLVAYAIHLDRDSRGGRVLSLAGYLVILVGWRVLYRQLGYGTLHSGVYLDPVHEPAAFLSAAPSRAAALLASQLALPWSDFATAYEYVSPRLPAIMTAIALATVAVISLAFVPRLRRDPVSRMFATGALLATVPICSTFPADRLLFFVGVGAMGLVASFLVGPKPLLARPLAWALVLIHVILAPPLLAIRSRSMTTVEKPVDRALVAFPHGPEVAGKTLILLNPPADPLAGFPQLMFAARGERNPDRVRWLATGTNRVDVKRRDGRTLVVRSEGGFYAHATEELLRSPLRPLPEGSRVALAGMTAEILATEPDGRPAEVAFQFDRPLDDPSFLWMRWEKTSYVPFAVPPVGERASLAPVNFLEVAFAE